MKVNKRHEARCAAVQALYQWQHNPEPANELIKQFMTDHDMKNISVDYFAELVRGVTQHHVELDELYKPYLDRLPSQLTPIELAALRLGTYELRDRLDVPYKVVINEATEVSKKFGPVDAHKYINAVLDKLAGRLRLAEKQAGRK